MRMLEGQHRGRLPDGLFEKNGAGFEVTVDSCFFERCGEVAANPAHEHVDASRAHALDEGIENAETNSIRIARSLQPQDDHFRRCVDSAFDRLKVFVEARGRTEEHFAFETKIKIPGHTTSSCGNRSWTCP